MATINGIITWLRSWFDDIYASTGHTHSNYLTSSDITGKQDTSNLSNDISTDASSTTKYPSVNAIKGYVDNLVSSSINIEVVSHFDITDLADNTDESAHTFVNTYETLTGYEVEANTIYLVPNDLTDIEFYYEFLVVDDGNDGVFSEMIGTTQVDLSNYATTNHSHNQYITSIQLIPKSTNSNGIIRVYYGDEPQ